MTLSACCNVVIVVENINIMIVDIKKKIQYDKYLSTVNVTAAPVVVDYNDFFFNFSDVAHTYTFASFFMLLNT